MNPFSEIKEVKTPSQETRHGIKGFENSTNDIHSPRHIQTINEGLKGRNYSGTDVKYMKHVFRLNGEKVEGVFPVFESKFDTRMPKSLWNSSDYEQFRYCTERIKQRIGSDPNFAKQFTPRQIEQIKDGAPRISGLTWHHNEIPGRMQLVNSREHEICKHTGGRSIWGGGSGCR